MAYHDKEVIDIIDGKNKTKKGVTEIERARIIHRTLGVSVAARYLRNRAWSVESTMFILLGK